MQPAVSVAVSWLKNRRAAPADRDFPCQHRRTGEDARGSVSDSRLCRRSQRSADGGNLQSGRVRANTHSASVRSSMCIARKARVERVAILTDRRISKAAEVRIGTRAHDRNAAVTDGRARANAVTPGCSVSVTITSFCSSRKTRRAGVVSGRRVVDHGGRRAAFGGRVPCTSANDRPGRGMNMLAVVDPSRRCPVCCAACAANRRTVA